MKLLSSFIRVATLKLPTGLFFLARFAAPVLMALIALLLVRDHPETYHSGLMLGLGIASGLVCFIGACALARQHFLRLLAGLLLLGLAALALPGLLFFGEKAVHFARLGGAMWFGMVGMACLAFVSLMIAGVLGYLGFRAMRAPGLWTAAMHLFIVCLLIGVYTDFYRARETPITCSVGGSAYPAGEHPFSVQVESYEVKTYEGEETYSLLRHDKGRWQFVGSPKRDGAFVRLGSESWPLTSLLPAPKEAGSSAQRYLLLPGSPPRLLLQHAAPVREYIAFCRLKPTINSALSFADGERQFLLRVNEPISFNGWLVYLLSADASGKRVQLLLRRSPGRPFIYIGAVGLALCSFVWGFAPKEERIAAA